MKVAEVMTNEVLLVTPDQPICEAAEMMANSDTGALPVSENDRLIGMITDRDIAVRAVAERKSADTPVRAVMSQKVLYCYDDEDVEQVAKNMGDNRCEPGKVRSTEASSTR